MAAADAVVFPIFGEMEHHPFPSDFLPYHEVRGPAHGTTHSQIICANVDKHQPYYAAEMLVRLGVGRAPLSTTSSVTTKNRLSHETPNDVVIATSAASRPVAISTRPI